MLRIDPEDYELAVTLAQAKVKDSESKLKTLLEEAAAAKEEWRIHRSGRIRDLSKPPPLVAKEPQLMAVRAKLEADKADLKKALLHLKRTEFKAPFDGRVRQENVDIGQYVSPGQPLATLYATDAVEVVIPLANEDLYWFHVPGFTPGGEKGAQAVVHARIAGRALQWKGEVVRSEGKIDETTRMVNVVVRVIKPYARKPPLAIGLFVRVAIQGRMLPEAVRIPRSALHQGNVVWIVKDGRLRFRTVTVARVEPNAVLLESGLQDGEMVVVTALKAVTDNMVVRTAPMREERS
jgi:RND family efflux transporter MFP subunit